MATNFYFQAGDHIGITPEQRLMESLILESIQIYGSDIYYLPRTSVDQDNFFGEDTLAKFTQAYPIEMYLANVQGWESSTELMSKFGIQVNDQATFIVSKRRWEESVALQTDDLQLPTRPAEGDLLYFPKTNSMFEIKLVNHLNPFYQLNKFYVYTLQVELLQYSSEQITTGIDEIDTRALFASRDLSNNTLLDSNDLPLLDSNGQPLMASGELPNPTINDGPEIREDEDEVIDFTETNLLGRF